MAEALRRLRVRGEGWILFALLLFWSLVWDYNHYGSYQRAGRVKLMLLAAGALAAIRFARTWHWTVGAFYLYLIANWLHFGFSPWVLPINGKPFVFTTDGFEEVAAITATLFLVPILAARVQRWQVEATVLAAAAIHSVLGILNLQGIYPGPKITQAFQENLPIGLLGQHTLLGPFLAFAFGIALVRAIEGKARARAGFAGLALLFLGVALLTKSSMTLGALFAAGLVVSIFYLGALVSILPVVAFVFLLLTANEHDANILWHSGRLEPWKDALSLHGISAARAWFGFGIGSWEPISVLIKEVRGYQFPWTYLHSEPLQILFELGRVGAGLLAAAFVTLLARIHVLYLFQDRENLTWILGLTVFGVNALANFPLHLVPHGPLFALSAYMIFSSQESWA